MGQAPPPLPRHREHNRNSQPLRRDNEQADVSALVEENAQLRELVIQLSKLVVRNVVNHR
jgi:hypothetical protein